MFRSKNCPRRPGPSRAPGLSTHHCTPLVHEDDAAGQCAANGDEDCLLMWTVDDSFIGKTQLQTAILNLTNV